MGAPDSKPLTQTSETQLSPEQKQVFNLAFPSVKKYATATPQLYKGPTIAGFNPLETQAQNQTVAAAGGNVADLANSGAAAQSFLLSPDILSPDSNPYLKGYGDNLVRTVTDNLMERVLPGIRSGTRVNEGVYSSGNTRQGISEGLAIGKTAQEASGGLADLYSKSYATGVDAMGSAVSRNPATMAAQFIGPEATAAVGAQQRAMEQAKFDEAEKRFYLTQQFPFLKARDLFDFISAMPGGKGVTTVDGAAPGKSKLSGALGGAATGAAIGSVVPVVGTGIGAALGGLAGFFS
jgi:hypothetical protein